MELKYIQKLWMITLLKRDRPGKEDKREDKKEDRKI